MIYPCIHRGEKVDEQVCKPCGTAEHPDKVKVFVFSCAVHKLCTLEKPVYQIIPGRFYVCRYCPWRKDSLAPYRFFASADPLAVKDV